MYLSRLILNPRDRQVQREIANPYERHRTIMQAFPDPVLDGERVLHRLDQQPHHGQLSLLVQSHSRPNWRWLTERTYLWPSDSFDHQENPAVKPFDLHLNVGQVLYFRLQANPTVKKSRYGRNSNRVPLVREEQQMRWLAQKAAKSGFRPLVVTIRPLGDRFSWINRGAKQRHRLKLFVVQYDGRLQVTNPSLLQHVVGQGIGPARAFGCGLLSLAP